MIKKEVVVRQKNELFKVLEKDLSLNFVIYNIALRKGDIKVNFTKVKENVTVNKGDIVTIYYKEKIFNEQVVYEDDNILVVNKPKKIETVSSKQNGESLLEKLHINHEILFGCHRLDFNTTGLVIFAKNRDAYNAVLDGFKEEAVLKTYHALVVGNPKQSEVFDDYLKKDSKIGQVYISSDERPEYVPVHLEYKLIRQIDNEIALVEVYLHNGKTHQIRAQFAYHNMQVLGDDKYGEKKYNRTRKASSQYLMSVRLNFNFNDESILCYLNEKTIEIEDNFNI